MWSMTLLIRAVSLKGQPLGRELSAQFRETGGTIGRGDSNVLVLPDPARYISRVHATVSFQAGGFVLTDNGTKNAVLVNGRPLGPGVQARLGEGDTIGIGDYLLQVSFASRSVSQTPPAASVPRDDPFAAFPSAGPKQNDPFADLIPRERQPTPPPAPPSWPEPARPRQPAPSAADPLASVRPAEPNIDEILGLKPPAADPLAPAPTPGSPLGGASPILPNDPFEDWPVIAKGGRAHPAAPDHTPEVNLPFFPPRPQAPPPQAPVAPPPPMPAAPLAPPPPRPEAPVPPPPPSFEPAARPASASREEGPRRESVSGVVPGRDELLVALLRGAGIPETKIPLALSTEMMETLGRLLHEAVRGTIDLLRARATTKGEMRADVTMIVPMDNNPLKFSPTPEAALVHLLAPSIPGFASPLRAMKEAYDDLRAHQLGFLAGMRAALDEVLERFEPGGLEERLSDPGILASLLPMNRKAKLWDLFVEQYGDVAADAREDFHAAFGKAFLRAYDEQVKRLRSEERPG